MKHIYGVETQEELWQYRKFAEAIQERLDAYIDFLKREYQVKELPKSIVWTSGEIAVSCISDMPLPAYTNKFRIVMTSDINTWREIYLKQLEGAEGGAETEKVCGEIRAYYTHDLSENHVLQILGHELAHYSELFLDDFETERDSGVWFEEGMVEYISRKYFLTEEEFEKEAEINCRLVDLWKHSYGNHSLEHFGEATYEGDYASIFFEYWRSFLAVRQLVNRYHGDVPAVFEEYLRWGKEGERQTLEEWFRTKEEVYG